MLANRVKKNHRRLHARFERESIGAYRLYDRDIPEVRAVVDWYEGHVVVGEYARTQTDAIEDWLETMAQAVASALGVPATAAMSPLVQSHARIQRRVTEVGDQVADCVRGCQQQCQRLQQRHITSLD